MSVYILESIVVGRFKYQKFRCIDMDHEWLDYFKEYYRVN